MLLSCQKIILVSLSLPLFTAASPPKAHELTESYSYEEYCSDFHKKANSVGHQLFTERLASILSHNASPNKTYVLGVNQFTDMVSPPKGRNTAGLSAESRTSLTLNRWSHTSSLPRVEPQPFDESLLQDMDKVPDELNWYDEGVCTAVKDQGHCGSCWAFATTATVESHVAIQSKLLYNLSPEQLVACAPNENHCGGYGGCMGSIPELAYDYLVSAGGYAQEWSYPYVSYSGDTNGTCVELDTSSNPIKATIDGYVKLPENNASAVMAVLAKVGPLAVNVDASTWSSYESGVFDSCSYDSLDIDHVVVLVGYGTDEDSGLDYWLIRNSWSPSWGEQGFIRLKRESVQDTICGVDNTPQDGTGCDGDLIQYPCGQCGVLFDTSYPTGAGVV